MPPSDDSSSENTYFINIEEAAETARLMEQDRLFTQAMGGLFPEISDLTPFKEVLDIGCGPGGWAMEVAFQHPDMQVVGIDINPRMIQYAFAQARVRDLQNVSFEVMDALQPLAFHDNSFDLVNARLIFGFMDQLSWPRLLAECQRILRPGGILRLTESDGGSTSSPALQRIYGLFCQLLTAQKRTFSVDGTSFGLAHRLGKIVQDAGFINVHKHPFIIDTSWGSEYHFSTSKDVEVAMVLLKPYILSSKLIEEEEYDQLYNRTLAEMFGSDFTGISYCLITWGSKPT